MPNSVIQNKGPWSHRALVWTFAAALTVLIYWLIGLVLKDVGEAEPPNYQKIADTMLNPKLVAEDSDLDKELAAVIRAIERDNGRQKVLAESTSAAQRTMNQLLDFQRLAIEKGGSLSPEEQKALADSQQIFLDNQRRFQEMNQSIAKLEDQRDQLQARKRDLDGLLTAAREPVQREFERQYSDLRWNAAARKLGLTVPLLLLAVVLFGRWRGTLYAPVMYAAALAVAIHVILVMNAYFPKRYFYYIMVSVALLVVLRILVNLLRSVAHPNPTWLVRQYREAYERFLCPVCEFPIRRGPLKYTSWTRRGVHRLPPFSESNGSADEPYTCPMCSTALFEPCPSCQRMRHSLLPACTHCGEFKSLDVIAARARGGAE